jgi:hypothetical protein
MLIGVETLAIAGGTRLWQQFHPVAYVRTKDSITSSKVADILCLQIVKLHIELSLGTLISKIAKGSTEEQENYLTEWHGRDGTTSTCALEKVATRPRNWRTESHESEIERGMEITVGTRSI